MKAFLTISFFLSNLIFYLLVNACFISFDLVHFSLFSLKTLFQNRNIFLGYINSLLSWSFITLLYLHSETWMIFLKYVFYHIISIHKYKYLSPNHTMKFFAMIYKELLNICLIILFSFICYSSPSCNLFSSCTKRVLITSVYCPHSHIPFIWSYFYIFIITDRTTELNLEIYSFSDSC